MSLMTWHTIEDGDGAAAVWAQQPSTSRSPWGRTPFEHELGDLISLVAWTDNEVST